MANKVMGWDATCGNIPTMAKESSIYWMNHQRVYRIRGAARQFFCEQDCGRKATQWSHIHESDPADPENYRPLCRSCHARYDGSKPPSQLGRVPANSLFTDEQAETIRRMVASGMTQRAVAKEFGCSTYPIWCIVNGKSHNRGGQNVR